MKLQKHSYQKYDIEDDKNNFGTVCSTAIRHFALVCLPAMKSLCIYHNEVAVLTEYLVFYSIQ